jgi:hypothetical protein
MSVHFFGAISGSITKCETFVFLISLIKRDTVRGVAQGVRGT